MHGAKMIQGRILAEFSLQEELRGVQGKNDGPLCGGEGFCCTLTWQPERDSAFGFLPGCFESLGRSHEGQSRPVI
jgi:hypothetical protein